MKRLVKKIKYTAIIELLSGLHIGATNTTMAIGGVDNFVIRNPIDQRPYIPGSSLKGKMRSLLELAYGEHNGGKVSDTPNSRCGALFGVSASSKDADAHASRLIVRDAMWLETDDSQFDQTDLYLTESKTEANIDRITSRATPRTQSECLVVPNSRLRLCLIYTRARARNNMTPTSAKPSHCSKTTILAVTAHAAMVVCYSANFAKRKKELKTIRMYG